MIAVAIILSIILLVFAVYAFDRNRRFSEFKEEHSRREAEHAAENARKDAEIASAEKNRIELRRECDEAFNREKNALARLSESVAENARLTERLRHAEEDAVKRAEEMSREKDRLNRETEERFNNLANRILEENSRRFKEQNETRLSEILDPLKENIETFKKTVSETYSTEARERFSLQERIKELIEINRTIGKEAKDLTEALKGNSKIQGDWGEMILETILEKSGLKRDIHFKVQQTVDESGNVIKDASGRSLRPDVVIYYPDGRCIVIDSKVSLTAYVAMVNSDSAEETERYGRQHLMSVKAHIKELSEKNYQEYIGDKKTDFVMMFIPNEAAYMIAMNLDGNLWQEAYDRRVLLISPTHLISALRLVEQLWRQDDMKRNVFEIAAESGKMYDKFVGFLDDMAKIEKGLGNSRDAFDNAMKKLKNGPGNLIKKAEDLRKMGAKASKRINRAFLPEPDENDGPVTHPTVGATDNGSDE